MVSVICFVPFSRSAVFWPITISVFNYAHNVIFHSSDLLDFWAQQIAWEQNKINNVQSIFKYWTQHKTTIQMDAIAKDRQFHSFKSNTPDSLEIEHWQLKLTENQIIRENEKHWLTKVESK